MFQTSYSIWIQLQNASDLLVNNFVYTALNKKKLNLFEPHFRRNFIHIRDKECNKFYY